LATPQVAGVAALILARNPDLTAEQVRDVLQSTASDLGSPGWDPFYGFGQVNAYRAVLQAGHDSGGAPDPVSAVIEAVNRMRQRRGLPALRADDSLMDVAQQRAERLISGCASNSGSNLETCVTSMVFVSQHQQEVILFGVSSPEAVVDLLASSPEGQRLLFGAFWQIGTGYVNIRRVTPSQFWILRFGQELLRPQLVTPIPISEGSAGK
jgi:hypothetical protein